MKLRFWLAISAVLCVGIDALYTLLKQADNGVIKVIKHQE